MLKRMAMVFGVILLLVGVAGYIPALTPEGRLLGIFEVDSMHNLVHIVTGIVAVMMGAKSEHASRVFFQTFGVVYGLVALLGLFSGDAPLLGMMAHNWADFWLHVGIAGFSLWVGFYYAPRHEHPHHAAHA